MKSDKVWYKIIESQYVTFEVFFNVAWRLRDRGLSVLIKLINTLVTMWNICFRFNTKSAYKRRVQVRKVCFKRVTNRRTLNHKSAGCTWLLSNFNCTHCMCSYACFPAITHKRDRMENGSHDPDDLAPPSFTRVIYVCCDYTLRPTFTVSWPAFTKINTESLRGLTRSEWLNISNNNTVIRKHRCIALLMTVKILSYVFISYL